MWLPRLCGKNAPCAPIADIEKKYLAHETNIGNAATSEAQDRPLNETVRSLRTARQGD